MAENNNRWWEFYLTRYLAANMFAVLVLFYLVAFHGAAIQKSLCPNGFDLQLCKGQFSTEVYGFIYQTTKSIASINREDEAKFIGFEFASDKKYERHADFGRSKHLQQLMPNAYFANLGLFTMKEAHSLACQSR